MCSTYILKSLKDHKFYIGCTNDLERRLKEHFDGRVKSTKYRRPLKLIYTESFNTNQSARKRELEIKRMKGGIQFKAIIAGIAQG